MLPKRLFLYSYNEEGNWEVTRDARIFGAKDDGTGTASKACRDLDIDDVVIVRDSVIDYPDCVISGACVIAGPLVVHGKDGSLGEDWLWVDEKRRRRVVYRYRWRVNIESAPIVTRKRIEWSEFDQVGAIGLHGRELRGRPQWVGKFRGNLITANNEVEAPIRIFGLRLPTKARGGAK